MKDPSDRTKVVVRRLPPVLSQAALLEQVDTHFAGRYDWVSFHPGKPSQKNQRLSRAYINFKRPEDVAEFAEFFHGHVFVNEKGIQFKAVVEYAPSQRVRKAWSKKDGREGTLLKDPEYLEFLEILAKPVEHLPSAEIQLERKEAERAAGGKEMVIVTPLMDFVRQKRASKNGSQRPSVSGKLSRRAVGPSSSTSGPYSKRGSEKQRRRQTTVYIQKDSAKNSTCILVPRKEEQQPLEKSATVASSATEIVEDEQGTVSNEAISVAGDADPGRRKFVLLKGKERQSKNHQSLTSQTKILHGPTVTKQTPRHEASGRIVRSILLNKDARQNHYHLVGSHSDQQPQAVRSEGDKRPPRPPNDASSLVSVSDSDGKKYADDRTADSDKHCSFSMTEKHDRRLKNRDRSDRVWAPLRRPDGSNASDDALLLSTLSGQQLVDSFEAVSISQQAAAAKGDDDFAVHIVYGGHATNSHSVYDVLSSHGAGRANVPYMENGSHRSIGRRGSLHGLKEFDGAPIYSDSRTSKRVGPTGHGSHDKQVWVQKSGSGS